MLGGLKRGDRVVTTGGLHGTITGLTEHTVSLRVADQVKLEVDRAAVGRVVTAPAGDKDA
jgi:preprotein translocase subunit YajC